MLKEGYSIPPGQGVNEEMKEVEMELEEKEELARKMGRRRSSISPYILEGGRVNSRKTRSNTRLPAPPDSPPSSPEGSRSPSPSRISAISSGVNNLFSLLLSPAWVQTFIMTFLGEWGDRSQIATIAMAAGQDYWWVTGGAVSGHGLCTAIAVIGGRAIAGRVSLRIGEYIPHCIFRMVYADTVFQLLWVVDLLSCFSASFILLRRCTSFKDSIGVKGLGLQESWVKHTQGVQSFPGMIKSEVFGKGTVPNRHYNSCSLRITVPYVVEVQASMAASFCFLNFPPRYCSV